MKRLALLTALILGLTAAAAAGDLPKIAVYVTGSVPENEKKVLGTRILTALVNSGRYRGIERSEPFLAEIDKEHVKQRSGAIDDSQISELGKQFGVKYVCIADITPAFKDYQVSARIINVETAEVAHIGEALSPLKTAKDLSEASDRVVANMFGLAPKRKAWMSAGGGFMGSIESGGGILWADEPTARISMPNTGMGAYVFFDAMYGQVSVGFTLGNGTWESGNTGNLPDMQRTSVILGIYGKYPVVLGRIALFPLIGADYELALTGKLENADGSTYTFDGEGTRPASNALSAAWAKGGGGADFNLNDNIYLRTEILYGLRTANTFENDMAKQEKGDNINAESKSGTGIFFKIGARYRF